jgi:hypothetical protein
MSSTCPVHQILHLITIIIGLVNSTNYHILAHFPFRTNAKILHQKVAGNIGVGNYVDSGKGDTWANSNSTSQFQLISNLGSQDPLLLHLGYITVKCANE